MGCPCKNRNRRAATASAADQQKQQTQPPGTPGKPLLWTGAPEKKPEQSAE